MLIVKFRGLIDKIIQVLSTIIMGVMVIAVCWQVITRYILNNPSTVTEEALRYLLIWVTMVGGAYAYGRRKHLAITALSKRLSFKGQKILDIFVQAIGIQKIGQRFVDSVDHAAYTLNGVPQTVEPFRRFVQGASARVYIYFDDTVIGDVAEVQLVDKDGDVIASANERVFTKTPGKGLYIAFKYNILEVEVESSNESL